MALKMLRSMFPSEKVDKAKLLETKRSNWEHDEWTRGSYSFMPLGATPESRVKLAETEGKLFFAGEATHSKFPSTVHGALWDKQESQGASAAADLRATPKHRCDQPDAEEGKGS